MFDAVPLMFVWSPVFVPDDAPLCVPLKLEALIAPENVALPFVLLNLNTSVAFLFIITKSFPLTPPDTLYP